MGKQEFPKWLAEEISSVKMKKSNTLELTGYLLEVNKKENTFTTSKNKEEIKSRLQDLRLKYKI